MGLLRNIWCNLTHSKHLTWQGSGDWLIYRCDKCEMVWPEPRYGQQPRGQQRTTP